MTGPMEARRQTMTVVGAREAKQELERAILALIFDYQATTGLPVESVELEHIVQLGGARVLRGVHVASSL